VRLLDRYLLRELLVPLAYCLCGFMMLWVSMDLFDKLGDFQKQRLRGLDVAEYYALKLPEMAVEVVPITLLLALLYALTNHARHQELTAMRAAGVSLWRLALPYFAVGLLFSLGVFAINEFWAPASVERAERIYDRRAKDQPAAARDWETRVGLHNEREGRTWIIEAYHARDARMRGPHLNWNLADGSRREITAERAWHDGASWIFTNAQELIYPAGPGALPLRSETNLLVLPGLSETPDVIKSEIKFSRIKSLREANRTQLSIQEIRNFQRLHRDRADRDAVLDTKLHTRLAQPWTSFFVVLIALPFGAASGRRNVYVGVASSILICFAYYALQLFMQSLGSGGRIPAWLAAWGPNIVCGLVGLGLTARAR
jgi:lipopolysaccharide export system permease protein